MYTTNVLTYFVIIIKQVDNLVSENQVLQICIILCMNITYSVIIYRIALNYGPSVYFFPASFNQATKQDRCLLSKETRAVYNL